MSASTKPSLSRDVPAVEARVALALHRGAHDAADHLDLFIGPLHADPDDRVARAWRLPLAAWNGSSLIAGSFAATELPAHRAHYLTLSAPSELAHARGTITPLWSGVAPTELHEQCVIVFPPQLCMRLTRTMNDLDHEHAPWTLLVEARA